MSKKLTNRESIPDVLAELTMDEKISLLSAWTAIHSAPISEHDIPSIVLTDGATGVNFAQVIADYKDTMKDTSRFSADGGLSMLAYGAMPIEKIEADFKNDPDMAGFAEAVRKSRPNEKQYICFPSGINIGATWDTECAYMIGQAVGWEMRNSGIDICLGPNVDIMRDPLGGRNYEMYSEDPFLVGQIAVAFTRGLQSTGVGACAKHLVANNQEYRRNTVNTHVSKRTLMEIYTAGFRAAVQEGKVVSLMSSLNAVNGKFSSYNRALLTDLVKKEWGFEGIVVSDWGAATAHPDQAINAGLDMVLPSKVDMSVCYNALEDGSLTAETVDEAVSRILGVICDLREIRNKIPAAYDRAMLDTVNKQTVIDGAVLLKNEGVLPLNEERIVFWGKRSKGLFQCGTGSTMVMTGLRADPFSATASLGTRVQFETWDDAEVLVYVASAEAGEGVDRSEMDLEAETRDELPLILREAKKRGLKTVVLLNIPGPVDVTPWIENADAVLCLFIPGNEGGNAAAELLLGKAEPAGRLPVTFPLHYYDTPAYPNFPGEKDDVYYGEGLFVGYRHYDARHLPVAFPFGYGLSYTTFYQELMTKEVSFDLNTQDTVQLAVRVTNTGKRTGSQTIQLYVAEVNPRILRPMKELKGFKRVVLAPGETKMIFLTLCGKDLACFDENLGKWVKPLGAYRLMVGTSATDIFAEIPMTVVGENPYVLGPQSLIDEILDNENAIEILIRHFPDAAEKIGLLHYVSGITLEALMTSNLIVTEPDANKVSTMLNALYEDLARLS